MSFRNLLLVIVAVVCSEICSAQSQNVIKTNIVSLFKNGVGFSFERALNESRSIQISTNFSSASASFLAKAQVVGLAPEYKFYISNWEDAPNGFYVAPTIKYEYGKVKSDLFNYQLNIHAFGPGFNIGYQKLIGDKVALEAALGPVYYNAVVTSSYDFSHLGIRPEATTIDGLSGFVLQVRLNFGLGF